MVWHQESEKEKKNDSSKFTTKFQRIHHELPRAEKAQPLKEEKNEEGSEVEMKERQSKQISPEEAIMILNDEVASGSCDFDEDGTVLTAYMMAVGALDRQTPKLPDGINLEGDAFICPQCKMLIYTSGKPQSHNYCLNCGQRLRWY